MPATIHLSPGKEKSLRRLHPWVFSGAIARVKGSPADGETVSVHSSTGDWLGYGAWSSRSQIRVRIWSFNQSEQINDQFFADRIGAAIALRNSLSINSNAWRVVAAESDELPGITIDKYDNWLVCQLLSTGAERWRDSIVAALRSYFPECNIFERSDVDVRKKEGLQPIIQLLYSADGEPPPATVWINENGLQLGVDIQGGHKTGYYLDQRDSRLAIQAYAKDKRVLNAFSYTGGFGIYAVAAGASQVVNLDVSEPALTQAVSNQQQNDLPAERFENMKIDVFEALRKFHHQGERFDVIVLDPPKFVDSKANLINACRGYKDINRLACMILNPGGTLITFSCSGLLSGELFQKVVADAALDAKRPMHIIEHLYQSADHPVRTNFPESLYLKGLVLRG
ncbi:23S rRNA methyltransferase [Pseudidiomarina salinarum]|uniref:23S rRNA methyltransferase n=1 Tax=Pseudidiomarina salinarum TaxID=435908 RepID=A0A094J1L1_9GAMM|nr:class I SAM-dependent methyltransferase [Pseudidiomarina salinarum]KFZ31934.1 23S rRNA methyltransferase [Pseudidiomarina salinarum]RUO70289.1 23S rRNA (cytosine(1962)-C(5))-methyltransferase RlmI [Pseudidiomarina salinarum]